mmetsp:Transcript_12108/g.33544  ORF Transcript_12108/g.33544 Transcript_12108/m.33544 type:complete len:436 (-) Transcript_12108:1646-2953(-)
MELLLTDLGKVVNMLPGVAASSSAAERALPWVVQNLPSAIKAKIDPVEREDHELGRRLNGPHDVARVLRFLAGQVPENLQLMQREIQKDAVPYPVGLHFHDNVVHRAKEPDHVAEQALLWLSVPVWWLGFQFHQSYGAKADGGINQLVSARVRVLQFARWLQGALLHIQISVALEEEALEARLDELQLRENFRKVDPVYAVLVHQVCQYVRALPDIPGQGGGKQCSHLVVLRVARKHGQKKPHGAQEINSGRMLGFLARIHEQGQHGVVQLVIQDVMRLQGQESILLHLANHATQLNDYLGKLLFLVQGFALLQSRVQHVAAALCHLFDDSHRDPIVMLVPRKVHLLCAAPCRIILAIAGSTQQNSFKSRNVLLLQLASVLDDLQESALVPIVASKDFGILLGFQKQLRAEPICQRTHGAFQTDFGTRLAVAVMS